MDVVIRVRAFQPDGSWRWEERILIVQEPDPAALQEKFLRGVSDPPPSPPSTAQDHQN